MKRADDNQMTYLLTEKEGRARYRLGRQSFRRLADETGATVRISERIIRYNRDVMDNALEQFRQSSNTPRA